MSVPSARSVPLSAFGSGSPSIRGPWPSSGTVTGLLLVTMTSLPRTTTVTVEPTSTARSMESELTVTRNRVPRMVMRKVSADHDSGRRGSKEMAPPWSRIPPNPNTRAFQTPPAEATCTPSEVFRPRLARSRNSPSWK